MQDSTIDRPARDALAALIANHLRGEIRTPEAHQQACENPLLVDSADPDILALADPVASVCEDLAETPEAIGAETRGWLARVAIFLRSDRRLRQVERSDFHARQVVGLAGIVLITLGIAAAFYLESWVVFVGCWAATGIATFIYQRLYGDRPPADLATVGRYAPFRGEASLRRHAQLLEDDHDLLALALGETEAGQPAAGPPRVRLSWFLFGLLYGTMYLPGMLRREQTAILLVDDEGEA